MYLCLHNNIVLDFVFIISKDNGHSLSLFETSNRGGNVARIQTSYMNTANKCLTVFASLTGDAKGEFIIYLISYFASHITMLVPPSQSR